MKEKLKSWYQFSDYQIAQLEYFFKTVFSEISKILIIGFLFRKELDVYCVTMLSLCLLRTATGGLHCKTFWGCLFASTTYIVLAIRLLPLIPVSFLFKILLLLVCIPVNYYIGPVTSDVHMPLTAELTKKSRIRAAVSIFLFVILIYAIPESKYTVPIFWITITHSLQLIAAKIRKLKKGDKRNEAKAD